MKFATSVENKTTGDYKFSDSPELQPTFTVQSSAPLTMYCGPLLEGKQLFTNELWPFNFLILVPVS